MLGYFNHQLKGLDMAFDLKDYIDVKTRVLMFYKRYPEGRLTFEFMGELPGNPEMIWGIAKAYQTPDDPTPTTGHAAELVHGKTPYTKGSELMVLETSAIGRAIGMLGIGIDKGLATADEVIRATTPENRSEMPNFDDLGHLAADPWGENTPYKSGNRPGSQFPADLMTEPQRKAIFAICKENTDEVVRNFKRIEGIDPDTKLSKRNASKLIETIKSNGFAEYLGAE